MKGFSLSLLILIGIICYLDAFLPSPVVRHHRQLQQRQRQCNNNEWITKLYNSYNSGDEYKNKKKNDENDDSAATTNNNNFSHADIVWKLRPPPETSKWKRLWLRFAANTIRLDCFLKRQKLPVALCPKGGQAVLEAYIYNKKNKLEKIGRFGFTTERGPCAPPIIETIQDIYGQTIPPSNNLIQTVGTAAIIYMFVEPTYRKKNLGVLALEVISLIHAIQGVDFTMLVVDDNGSGKLINWYEQHGYSRAPKLQNLLGSPNAIHGITMISPTKQILPQDCHIKWW